MPLTFTLTEEQSEKISQWMAKRPLCPTGTIGGRYTYCFSHTSLGVVVRVKDELNGDVLDVSDYDSW